jgi:hypothetical protein
MYNNATDGLILQISWEVVQFQGYNIFKRIIFATLDCFCVKKDKRGSMW